MLFRSSTLQVAYDTEVVEHACRAIAESARDPRPLLLVASFTHPHDPYEVPAGYWERYEGVEIDAPVWPDPPEPIDAPTRRLRAMVAAERIPVSQDQALLARRGYYGAIALVDDHVGTILSALAEHGLAGDTVVVVTSDHGDMLGERGLWYKMAPFEDSIRVPLIVHAPGRFAAAWVARPVSLLDLVSTLLDLAGGFEPAAPVDGVSLVPALSGDALPTGDVPLEYLAEGVRAPQVTLVRGPLKLVRELGEPPLLYDVERDPGERVNLADEPGSSDEAYALLETVTARWDLERLDDEVRASQERRRLVARALATGERTIWDHPTDNPAGPYIRSGDDFWRTLEAARRPSQ